LGQTWRAVPIIFSVQASEPRHWFCGPSQVMVRIALLVFALVSRFRSRDASHHHLDLRHHED
jgi:hypothetical protein